MLSESEAAGIANVSARSSPGRAYYHKPISAVYLLLLLFAGFLLSGIHSCLQTLKRHWNWLRWPLVMLLVSWLFLKHRDEFSEISLSDFRWGAFLLAFSLFLSAMLITFYRWYLLVSSLGIDFRYRDAVRLSFLGYLFNYIAPGGAGGDLAKAILIAREHPQRKTVVVATIMLDRILGMMALFAVGLLVSLLFVTSIRTNSEFHPIIWAYAIGAAGGFVGLILMLVPAVPNSKLLRNLEKLPVVGPSFEELLNGIVLYQKKRLMMLNLVGLSIFSHFLVLSCFYFSALTLFPSGQVPNYVSHLQFIPAAELAGVLIPLPGGIGALEGAAGFFYGLAGAREADGLIAMLPFRAVSLMLAAVGAFYYLTDRKTIDEALEEAEHENDSSGLEETGAAMSPEFESPEPA